ncbi:MAG: hypothetical protein ABJE66_26525 [Deltaproteobacteria bacterium]
MARPDAETAIELKLPQTVENAALGNCDYTTPDFYGASLTVSDWSSIKAAATSSGHHPSVVTGVGDEALWGAGISVRKGDRGFLLVLNGPVVDHLPDKGLAKAKVLALTILPKL